MPNSGDEAVAVLPLAMREWQAMRAKGPASDDEHTPANGPDTSSADQSWIDEDGPPAGRGDDFSVTTGDGRIEVQICPDEAGVCDAAIAALAQSAVGVQAGSEYHSHVVTKAADVYDHGGRLARVVTDPDGRARIIDLNDIGVRDVLSRAILFVAWKPFSAKKRREMLKNLPDNPEEREKTLAVLPTGRWVPAHPPAWSSPMVRARGTYPGMRPLDAVAEAPFLRLDGSVVTTPGYDAATRTLYAPTREYPDLPEPTLEAAKAAWNELDEIFCDFPLKGVEDRAAAIAFALTVAGRTLIEGPTPAFVAEGNCPGTGKGKLIESAYAAVTGRELATSPATRDDEALRKRITSQVGSGQSVIFLDNLRFLGGPVIDALLTSRRWNERAVGDRDAEDLPARAVVAVTGNGLTLEGDVARRVLPIRLLSEDPTPEHRTGFAHRLPEWAIQEHPRLHAAALTILRVTLTNTDTPSPVWGSYEGWCQIVGRAVKIAGNIDVLATRATLREEDVTLTALRQFLIWLDAAAPMTATELIGLAERREFPVPEVQESLSVLAPTGAGRLHPRALGTALRRHSKRRVAMQTLAPEKEPCGTLELAGKLLHGTMQWSAVYHDQNGNLVPIWPATTSLAERVRPWDPKPEPPQSEEPESSGGGEDEIVV